MAGILYGVGVGPGDPELMTLKAVRLIRENEVIALPGPEAKETVAYQIAVQAVPELAEKTLLSVDMPMTHDKEEMKRNHDKAADFIETYLRQEQNVIFLTLGDPAIYSTCLYVQKRILSRGYKAELVSGITSFCAAAARANISLAEWNEQLHILPAVHRLDIPLEQPGNYVLMKSGKKMQQVKEILSASGRDVVMVENCGMENEHIYHGVEEIPDSAGYYSLIIAKEPDKEKSLKENSMNQPKKKHEITFLPSGMRFFAEEGMTLLEAQIQAGLKPDAPCGGKGTCGKCLVDIHTEKGIVREKACSVHITEPLTVTLLHTQQTETILTQGSFDELSLQADPLPIPGVYPEYLAACDLGSTTIVVYLMDARDGKLLSTASALNPQTSYAADVIGRIDYAIKNGAEALTQGVRKTIDELLASACSKAQITPAQITHLCLVGNCCMHHLFFGIPTDSLAVIPYSPSVTEAMVVPAKEYGLSIHPQGVILALPNMAGFVGADTVGCLSAARFDQQTKMTLLLDIGTNGELVLGTSARRFTCSTAAGPALEGAKISCGMRGATGAIDHVWLENGRITFSVIGQEQNPDLKPCGICGSGLIDAVSLFLEQGILDDTGRFTEAESWPEPSACVKIDKLTAYAFTDTVSLTQKDIREVQLAKAAIAAGIQLMCEQLGITASDIEQVLIAGAFGNYMNPANACRIGLIPYVLKDRIIPMGNAAGTGARLCALSQSEFERAKKMAAETEFLELASLAEFQDTFVDELGFE